MEEEIGLNDIIIPSETSSIKEKTPYHYEEDDSKHPITYKTIKKWVYFLLERPNSRVAVVYHFMSLMLIVGSLAVSVLATIEEMERDLDLVIFYYEMFLLIWFSSEFIARMWSCSYISRYQGKMGRLRFLFSVYMLIDIFVILSTVTTFALQIHGSYFAILRVTRFMQVFRILRIDRQRGDFRTMGRVVREHGKELITVYFVGFVIMFSATYIVYIVEKHTEFLGLSDPTGPVTPAPSNPVPPTNGTSVRNLTTVSPAGQTSDVTINNMANGLYWAVITVTSVGYGDLSPVTWMGKFCCAIFALIGCAFFSLPAGILGSGFALQVAKQKKEKRFVKVRNPAAYLIQTMWRNYALQKEKRGYDSTWYYLLPQLRDDSLNSTATQQTLDQMLQREIEKGSLELGEMFPPIFSPERQRTRRSFLTEQQNRTNPSPPTNNAQREERVPLVLHNNNLFEDGFKRLGKIITRRGSDDKAMILNREILLKNKVGLKDEDHHYHKTPTTVTSNGLDTRLSLRHRKDVGDDKRSIRSNETDTDHHHDHGSERDDERIEKIYLLMHTRYKIALRFIMKLRYWTAVKIFKSVRHPFVNMQDIMEKNALGHVEMLSHIKDMRDSFNVLQRELIELRYSLMELKHEREKENALQKQQQQLGQQQQQQHQQQKQQLQHKTKPSRRRNSFT